MTCKSVFHRILGGRAFSEMWESLNLFNSRFEVAELESSLRSWNSSAFSHFQVASGSEEKSHT